MVENLHRKNHVDSSHDVGVNEKLIGDKVKPIENLTQETNLIEEHT